MLVSLFALLLLASSIAAQNVPLYQAFDCTKSNFRPIYTACSAGDYSVCCAVGSDCCAGGCCPQGSWCVGQGSSSEKCCPGTDANNCGLTWLPDVICTGLDGFSSFACPHKSTCDQFADVCDAAAGGNASPDPTPQSTNTQATSSAVVKPSSQAPESTVQVTSVQVVTSVVQSDTSTNIIPTTSDREVVPSTSPGVSVSVLTLSASSQPAATTTKSNTASSLSASWSLPLIVLDLALLWL